MTTDLGTHRLDKIRLMGIYKDRIFLGPKTVFIQVTNVCNLRCLYCWYHSSLKTRQLASQETKKEFDFDVFRRVIDDCFDLGVQRIQISAKGEPTLHPRINEMIDYVKKNNFELIFFTNATFNKDTLKHLAKADEISIDLSAVDLEGYKAIQSPNAPELFGTVLKNISFFSALKRRGKQSPFVTLTYVLNAKNYTKLPHIFKLAHGLKVGQLHIKNIDIFDHSAPLFLTIPIQKEIDGILKKIAKERYFREVNSNVRHNYLTEGRFLDELYLHKLMRPQACYQGWHYSFITVDGCVTPCCKMHKDLIIGNVYERSFKALWLSKKFQKIRLSGKRTLYNGSYEACDQCCFYSLNEKIRRDLSYLCSKVEK